MWDAGCGVRGGGGPDGPQILYGECAQAGLICSLAPSESQRPCVSALYKIGGVPKSLFKNFRGNSYQLLVISSQLWGRFFLGEASFLYKNGLPSNLMRASFTVHYELRTEHFINFGHSKYCVMIVQLHTCHLPLITSHLTLFSHFCFRYNKEKCLL